MEYLVINEMSVECQASSLQHVDALMKEMADALKALDPIRRELFVHENICNHEDSHHAPMDLHDEIAQQVLDRAVSVPRGKTRRRIARRPVLCFPSHRAEANTYHGFLVAESEVEQKLPKHYQLLRRGSPLTHSPHFSPLPIRAAPAHEDHSMLASPHPNTNKHNRMSPPKVKE